MRNLPFLLGFVVVAIIAGVVMASFAHAQGRLRPCGHPRDLLSEVNPFQATHCCTSGRTVNELASIYVAEQVYQMDHGIYATTFEQLTNEYTRLRGDYFFKLVADSNRWSVTVTQQETLAGSYLLTSDGKLHFSKTSTVTTNDLVLRELNK